MIFISLPQAHPPCKLPSAIQSRNSSRTKHRHRFNSLITSPLIVLFLWHNAPLLQYLGNSPELLRRPPGLVQSRQHPPPQHLRASQSAHCAIQISKIPRSQDSTNIGLRPMPPKLVLALSMEQNSVARNTNAISLTVSLSSVATPSSSHSPPCIRTHRGRSSLSLP